MIKWLGWIGMAALLLAAVVYRTWPAYLHPYPHSCPMQMYLGLHCPGCGGQRSFSYLMHGEWASAARYHLLVPLIAITLPALMIRKWLHRQAATVPDWLAWASLAFLVVFAIFRNLPLYPFTLLAPPNQ